MSSVKPENNAFHDLIRRVRGGDEEAAAELVRRYEPAIRRAARLRLADSRLRRLCDSADIAQAVFTSFFVRAALGQYDLHRPENLLKLLVDMSRNKLADQERKQQAARRDYRRERAARQPETSFVAPGPSPSQVVAARELFHEFRRRLSEEERRLADLRAEGLAWARIAALQGGNPEALRKQLARAVERIGQELGVDGFGHE